MQPTPMPPSTMTIKLVEFCMWLDSELIKENANSHSADFTTRKAGGSRFDTLRQSEKLLQEFLAFKKSTHGSE